jgi:hypothetical protein
VFLVLGFASLPFSSLLRIETMQNQNTQNQNQPATIENENHYQPVGGFLPALNKAGKVTNTAQKRAVLLNALDTKGIQAMAVNGRGAMAKAAAASLGVDSLDSLLGSQNPLSGGQIATLRAMIVGAYGEALFNRETHKGLGGLVEYLGLVAKKLELDQATAETATAQGRVLKRLAAVRAEAASVQRLIELRDAAIASAAPAAPAVPAAPKAKAKAKA